MAAWMDSSNSAMQWFYSMIKMLLLLHAETNRIKYYELIYNGHVNYWFSEPQSSGAVTREVLWL